MISVFQNIDDINEFADWDGKKVEILGVVANPNDNSILDPDSMPQFHIKLIETGQKNTAYVDEIPESDWTDEMKAVLEGQKAFALGVPENSCTGKHSDYFKYGYQLGDFKGLDANDFPLHA